MNIANILAILVGVQVFLFMLVLKKPIKALNHRIVIKRFEEDSEKAKRREKRLNFSVIIVTILLSVMWYYIICMVLHMHHKLCCSFKAAVLALSIYAVYEQWFGET